MTMGVLERSSMARRGGIGAAIVYAIVGIVILAVMLADLPKARAFTNLSPTQMKFDVVCQRVHLTL